MVIHFYVYNYFPPLAFAQKLRYIVYIKLKQQLTRLHRMKKFSKNCWDKNLPKKSDRKK